MRAIVTAVVLVCSLLAATVGVAGEFDERVARLRQRFDARLESRTADLLDARLAGRPPLAPETPARTEPSSPPASLASDLPPRSRDAGRSPEAKRRRTASLSESTTMTCLLSDRVLDCTVSPIPARESLAEQRPAGQGSTRSPFGS